MRFEPDIKPVKYALQYALTGSCLVRCSNSVVQKSSNTDFESPMELKVVELTLKAVNTEIKRNNRTKTLAL